MRGGFNGIFHQSYRLDECGVNINILTEIIIEVKPYRCRQTYSETVSYNGSVRVAVIGSAHYLNHIVKAIYVVE